MRIATWNVERLKQKCSLDKIIRVCEDANADVLVLTESDERIMLHYHNSFHTPTPPDLYSPQYTMPIHYAETEHRVSIYTNYEVIRQHTTFDRHTSLCVELKTEHGNLLIYGTIIGVLGNREASFLPDLLAQLADIQRLAEQGYNLCVLGDYNCSFCNNYYFTTEGRDTILRAFEESHISILTRNQPMCIDHIALSDRFTDGRIVKITEWNLDKLLSDHKGIMAEL